MDVIMLLSIYLIIINMIAFFLMGIDKQRAKKHAFRVPEATLFTIAIIGGSIGSIMGMYAFRHKTRHPAFLYGLPIILIVQLLVIYALYKAPITFVIM